MLPFWILAMTKILYSDSFSSKHDVEWIDKHDNKGNFVDIEIRVKDPKGVDLGYVITVHLDSNIISVQGQNYLEFINSIFPDILELVSTRINAHQVPTKKLITKLVQPRSVGIVNQNGINDRLNALESKLQSPSRSSTPVDLSIQFQDIKTHMSQSAKQISDSLRENFKEISAKSCEVSLLVEEIDSKSKEISVLKDKVKMSQKAASKLDALEKEN
eukprot:Seg4340.1 transcript_id=Seg4340.1/GoldUCD/mRNA.D3Y31 product="hypothetical protein" protein_id=Seg4340.1/GoldUCD/D3Y31